MHSQWKFLEIGTYCYLSDKASKNLLQEIKRYCQPSTDLRSLLCRCQQPSGHKEEKRTRNRYTSLCYQQRGRWAKAGGQPSVAFAIGSALQLTATKRGVVFMVFSFWPSVKQKKVAKEGSKAATSATTTPCRRHHGHRRRRL